MTTQTQTDLSLWFSGHPSYKDHKVIARTLVARHSLAIHEVLELDLISCQIWLYQWKTSSNDFTRNAQITPLIVTNLFMLYNAEQVEMF